MAKVIMPPQISSLDELLDIVVHPEKFAARLKQMIEVRDAITDKIGGYVTKEEANTLLAEAQENESATRTVLLRTKNAEEDAAVVRNAKLDQLQKDQDAWTKAKDAEQESLKRREAELHAVQSRLDIKSAGLAEREAKLNEQDAVLARLSAKLKAEQEKMDKRKELLNAI